MTRADLKHCGKIPDAREELNRSVREGRIESRHSIKSLRHGEEIVEHAIGECTRIHHPAVQLHESYLISTNLLKALQLWELLKAKPNLPGIYVVTQQQQQLLLVVPLPLLQLLVVVLVVVVVVAVVV